MTKVYIETYGCWLNRAESEIIRRIVKREGGIIVNDPLESDVIVVNTCAVREETELRMLNKIRELSKAVSSNKKLIVTGCLTNIRPYTISKLVPHASLVEPDAIEDIKEVIFGKEQKIIIRKYSRRKRLLPLYEGGVIYIVPIESGCLGNCSFCIERISRGSGVKSYSPDSIVRHVADAIRKGAKEVFLTGQDVAAYGYDIGLRLTDLLRIILEEVKGDYKVRLGMMEPWLTKKIARELAYLMKDERVFKYLHLPIQSGDDKVLKLMNRKYDTDSYIELVNTFRRVLGDMSLATDIIVGYPGEDDRAFKNTISIVEQLKFDKVHIARYTLRPFTKAYLLPQIPESVKKERSRILSNIVFKVAYEVNMKYVGKRKTAIVEKKGIRPDSYIARTEEYKPVIVNDHVKLGEKVEVTITGATPINLIGKITC
ncbi:MAG: hypothetical protein DRJ41_00730 [Thermoprotei archaeon]|nr:MAG: hypothetical protein DRJ41_00730 [Thermoprotei archaeon]